MENTAQIYFKRGLSALNEQQFDKAIQLFNNVLSMQKCNVDAYNALGIIHARKNETQLAISTFKKAIAIKPHAIEAWINLGLIYREQGDINTAIQHYEQALRENPQSDEILSSLGNIYCSCNRSEKALACFRQVVTMKPNSANYHYQLGFVLHYVNQFDEALYHYQKTLSLEPHHPNTLFYMAHIYRNRRQLNKALSYYKKALEQVPDNKDYFCSFAIVCNELCCWDPRDASVKKMENMLKSELANHQKTSLAPFDCLAFPLSAELKHAVAVNHSKAISDDMASYKSSCDFTFHRAPHAKLRIGYVSCDFYEHATSQLLWGVFKNHDRANFKIYAYSHGPDKQDKYRKHIVDNVDEFIDIERMNHVEAAQRIYQDEIDILVDLKGFTQFSRLAIFALRPAPIQVTYLGYPGSLGADFIDYIITDPIVTPSNQTHLYTEKILYTPDCYQANHQHHEDMTTIPSRSECGLPESAFVYCCFNNSFKINPEIFTVWMNILRETQNTVLWLYQASPDIAPYLLSETTKRGISQERIIFAPSRPKADHLARHKLADLFLDTTSINAHTTASDALWAGLPVLTCRGETFCQRVAASLLTYVGLQDFITDNLDDYEEKAIYYAKNKDELKKRRSYLDKNRLTAPLFDSPKYTKNLEQLYTSIATKEGLYLDV